MVGLVFFHPVEPKGIRLVVRTYIGIVSMIFKIGMYSIIVVNIYIVWPQPQPQ